MWWATSPNSEDNAQKTDSRLAELCRELFKMLDSCEVSDSGREFYPTEIHSCRAMHCARLDEILPEMRELSHNDEISHREADER